MPITRRQFDLGINEALGDWMSRIYSYLSQRPDLAFSAPELAQALGLSLNLPEDREYFANREEGRFFVALEKLAEANIIQAREVGGQTYFAPGRYTLDQVLAG